MQKNLLWIFFILIVGFIAACSNTNQRQTHMSIKSDTGIIKLTGISDTLAYVWRTFDNGDTIGKGFHFHQTLSYPKFKNNKALNDTINKQIGDLNGWVDKPGSAVNNTADTTNVESDNTEDEATPASEDLSVQITGQYRGFIVLNFSQDQSGGVHPNHRDTYLNWDTKAHKTISLSDLFIKDYEADLDVIGEKLFRKEYQLRRKGSMGVYFQGQDFFLPDNFIIGPDGLNFVYGSYTIASYMDGYPSLLIPYQSIKHLLRPNTVISQFIK